MKTMTTVYKETIQELNKGFLLFIIIVVYIFLIIYLIDKAEPLICDQNKEFNTTEIEIIVK